MTAPRPGGLYALRPMLSNDTVLGRETVTSMERRASASATIGGVNADLFTWSEGLPSGMFMQSGVLTSPPHPRRSSVGITDDGRLLVQRVRMLGTWRGSSGRRPLTGLNQRPGPNGASLFTPAWGATTPAAQGTVEVTLDAFPPAAPATDLSGTVVSVKPVRRHPDSARRRSARRSRHLVRSACVGGSDRPDGDRDSHPAAPVGRSRRRGRRRAGASSATASPSSGRSRASRATSFRCATREPRSVSARTAPSSSSRSTAASRATAPV